MAPWNPRRAATLTQRGEWGALLALLREHAPDVPEAAHSLGALLHGAAGAAVPMDVKASALQYCCCVRRALEQAQARGVRPSVAFPVVFGDAVHAVGAALEFEEVRPGEPEHAECVATLRRVAHDCGRSEVLARSASTAKDAEAAMNAYFSLGVDAFQQHDREEAARRYRQVLNVFETAGGAAVNTEKLARDCVDGAAANLRVLEAKTPEEHQLASQMQRARLQQADPEHWEQRSALRANLVPTGGMQRPACAGCGATPLTLKLCKGSCGGAGADGKFCSTECFVANWKAHKEKTGCRNVAAASSGSSQRKAARGAASAAGAAGAASQPVQRTSATAAAAGTASPQRAAAPRAATPTKQRIKYKVAISDDHGHEASYETLVEVDAALFAAAKNATSDDAAGMAAFQRIISICFSQSKAAVLGLRPFRCFGCGDASPTCLLNNVMSYLRSPPPDGPMLFDMVQPYCERGGPCEGVCRQYMRDLHAELASEGPGLPPHVQMS